MHRTWSVLTAALPIILIVSLLPQTVLAIAMAPSSSVAIPNPYYADFGDLPDSYSTTRAASGPYHNQGSQRLGTDFDWEYDGAPTADASGDDVAEADDEDGVDFVPPPQCAGATLQFTVTVTGGSGKLGVWFDWNQNGGWDTEEGLSQLVVPGANVVTVVCPADFDDGGVLNARFRLYAGEPANVYPTGGVTDGEVEDYTWTFTPTAARVVGLAGNAQAILPLHVTVLVLGVTVATFSLRKARRHYVRTRAG